MRCWRARWSGPAIASASVRSWCRCVTDRHVWARSYDGELSHILALQQRIASEIAAAIGRPALVQRTGADAKRPVAPEAYRRVSERSHGAGLQRFDGYRTAVGYFEQAVARQPDFAEAHATLAQVAVAVSLRRSGRSAGRDAESGGGRPPRHRARRDAGPAAPDARADPQPVSLEVGGSGEGISPRGAAKGGDEATTAGVSLLRTGRFAEAIAEAERAPVPGSAVVRGASRCRHCYRAAGQHDRAIVELRRALKITPGQIARSSSWASPTC